MCSDFYKDPSTQRGNLVQLISSEEEYRIWYCLYD